MPASGDRAEVPENMVPFRKLDTAKRRRAGVVYVAMSAVAAALAAVSGVNLMWLTAVAPLIGIAIYQYAGAWQMKVTDMDAISDAANAASFSFGHGSATLGYRGWLARPVWQVLIFAAGSSPEHQALVTVNALSGEVTGIFEQDVDVPNGP